jgi:hypothetical protein
MKLAVSNKRLAALGTSLFVATLSFGIPIVPIGNIQQKALAVDFNAVQARFVPALQINGNTATLVIPKDLLEAVLSQSLKVNEQRLKDTEFNRITLKNTNCKIVGRNLKVSGNIQVEHRELIAKNPFTGKKHYSPWVSVSGKVTQLFNVAVQNNKTVVNNVGDPKLEGLESRWYADVVSGVGPYIGPKITPKVTEALSKFNKLDIRQYAIVNGSPLIASKLGIRDNVVRSALDKNIGPINAVINNNSDFTIAFTFPQLK